MCLFMSCAFESRTHDGKSLVGFVLVVSTFGCGLRFSQRMINTNQLCGKLQQTSFVNNSLFACEVYDRELKELEPQIVEHGLVNGFATRY